MYMVILVVSFAARTYLQVNQHIWPRLFYESDVYFWIDERKTKRQFSHWSLTGVLLTLINLNTIWKRACPRIWKSNCCPVKRCCCVFLDASEELPVPPTWFNYTDVRSQWELVKPLWLFSSRALRLSLPRQWCDAQHHTSSIIHEIFFHMRPLMTHYVKMTLWLCFSDMHEDLEMWGTQWKWRCMRSPFFVFTFVSLISQVMANCLLGVFRLCPSPSLEEIGVPLVVVAMTTTGTLATGGKFVFHDINWTYCSIYTRWGIMRGLGA